MSSIYAVPPEVLEGLVERNKTAITRLREHQPEQVDYSSYPSTKWAGVLVLLYEKAGELRVLLTTRDKRLRAHPGQVALPGGKRDPTDADFVETAFREAHEEVGLPRHFPHAHTICTLRQFVASTKLLVTPVIALLSDLSVLETLKPSPGEVDRIFDHPLEAMLDPTLAAKEKLAPIGSDDWIYPEELHNFSDIDLPWLANSTYRMHRFRSTAFAIKGLTADVLIATAEIAYNKQTTFERWAPKQISTFAPILHVFLEELAAQGHTGGASTTTPNAKTIMGVNSEQATAEVEP
ncbi:NUDIX hydrolase domain-like protein [Epithele typhae]|uniref:NUDIX hydrolase domain-like protein n=1 Tax=Epithele typhae TaxID=378194 RepID=UPI002007B1C5|nr:NUDIX hydrolase domain-like protein [Epithele typhae]KAH9945473.1 NUDIX hydrolase domain-like protein [Epithele typhae]